MKKRLAPIFIVFLGLIFTAYSQNPYNVKAASEEEKIPQKTLSKEEKFVSENFPFINMADWQPGMKFIIEPDYLDIDNRLDLKPRKNSSYSEQPLQKDYAWKIVELKEVKNSTNKSYFTFECEGQKLIYVSPLNLSDLKKSLSFSHINHLVYLKDIDKSKELLLNKQLYILTERWLKENEAKGEYIHSQKFVPVTITNIGMGETDGPVKIIFKTADGTENFLNVRFSGINTSSKIFGIDFVDAFSFDNPRDLYPEISDEMWTMIQNGRVKIGMTKTEAELAWGKPKEINTDIYGSSSQEQWVYSSSSYIYFENGKLSAIQN